MKIRGILLTLFLSFSGIGLVGCGLFDAVKEISAAAAKKIAEEAKKTADEAIATAEKERTDNPGVDHSVCDQAIEEAGTAKTEADKAIEAATAAQDGTADDVTTAHDQAKAVKTQAENAKKKAKDCAKGEETPAPETKKAVLVYYYSGVSKRDNKTECPADVTAFIPSGEDSCSKGSGDCVAKATEWKAVQETAGYTCTEEEKERTGGLSHCPPAKETHYTCTKQ